MSFSAQVVQINNKGLTKKKKNAMTVIDQHHISLSFIFLIRSNVYYT